MQIEIEVKILKQSLCMLFEREEFIRWIWPAVDGATFPFMTDNERHSGVGQVCEQAPLILLP